MKTKRKTQTVPIWPEYDLNCQNVSRTQNRGISVSIRVYRHWTKIWASLNDRVRNIGLTEFRYYVKVRQTNKPNVPCLCKADEKNNISLYNIIFRRRQNTVRTKTIIMWYLAYVDAYPLSPRLTNGVLQSQSVVY